MKFIGKSAEPERVRENVWSPETSKVCATFENGIFETEDKKTIELLQKLGYEELIERPVKVIEKVEDTPMSAKRKPKKAK